MIAVSSSDHGAPWELQLAKIQAKIKTCLKNGMIPIEEETLSPFLYIDIMAIGVVEFSNGGYKIRKFFA